MLINLLIGNNLAHQLWQVGKFGVELPGQFLCAGFLIFVANSFNGIDQRVSKAKLQTTVGTANYISYWYFYSFDEHEYSLKWMLGISK